jgi:hypothetical protein
VTRVPDPRRSFRRRSSNSPPSAPARTLIYWTAVAVAASLGALFVAAVTLFAGHRPARTLDPERVKTLPFFSNLRANQRHAPASKLMFAAEGGLPGRLPSD